MTISVEWPRPENRLLASLPADDYAMLAGRLEPVRLVRSQTLQRRGVAPAHVYFPRSAVAAMVLDSEDGGKRGEVLAIGREGIVGLSVFLSGQSDEEIVARVGGDADRMDAAEFRALLNELPALRDSLGRYTQALLRQVARSALCDRVHSLEQRLATTLLLMHDRVGSDRVPITHGQLATLLGVRRAGVTEAAGRLRDAECIQYSRGEVMVQDCSGLRLAACGCYGIMRDQLGLIANSHEIAA